MREVVARGVRPGHEDSRLRPSQRGSRARSPSTGRTGSRARRREHLIERPLEQPPALEPVVVVAEAVMPCACASSACASRVSAPAGRRSRVGRDVGWSWPGTAARARTTLRPLGEALAPPLVVLGDRMELRQVEREEPGPARSSASARRAGSRPATRGRSRCDGHRPAPRRHRTDRPADDPQVAGEALAAKVEELELRASPSASRSSEP